MKAHNSKTGGGDKPKSSSKRRARLLAAGICTGCGRRPVAPGHALCLVDLKRGRERAKVQTAKLNLANGALFGQLDGAARFLSAFICVYLRPNVIGAFRRKNN